MHRPGMAGNAAGGDPPPDPPPRISNATTSRHSFVPEATTPDYAAIYIPPGIVIAPAPAWPSAGGGPTGFSATGHALSAAVCVTGS